MIFSKGNPPTPTIPEIAIDPDGKVVPLEIICTACAISYGKYVGLIACNTCSGTHRSLIPFSEVWGL